MLKNVLKQKQQKEKVVVHNSKGENIIKDGVLKYIYTYDCRCGGQYIVDESAEQYCRTANHDETTQIVNSNDYINGVGDDADNKTINDSSIQNDKNVANNITNTTNNAGGSSSNSYNGARCSKGIVLHNADDDDDDVDEEGGGELIVECSECSLVIILNG
ncbi:hypothetical protein EVAR_101168_1 [Eumeta japonica]|uniref:Uncharacterized protein n=1 Tax=Eumeta variegata TaxID=151549 RepID=A0A4C1SME1_EUMVA|nr:hypothetical protein EVAR_101168_1 [Eumeta japonica]